MYEQKRQILQEFLELHKNLPEQGSDEWLNNRQFTIGGSEISTLMGLNPYSNTRELIKTKLGLSKFVGNTATNWGKIFEPCAQILLEDLFKCNLYETGSLPGKIPGTSYSPDGFATVKTDAIVDLINRKIIKDHDIGTNQEAVNVVFEIKSPFSRRPKPEVPEHYKPQPLSALSHFDFLDIAYFSDFKFVPCGAADYSDDTMYPQTQVTKFKSCIGFASKKEYDPKVKICDLGALSDGREHRDRKLANIFSQAVNGSYYVFYFDIGENVGSCATKLRQICEKDDILPVGILPFKIEEYYLLPVYRQENYLEKYQAEITRFFEILNQIKNAECPQKKFDEIFNR